MWQRKECGCVFTDVGVKMIIKFLLFLTKSLKQRIRMNVMEYKAREAFTVKERIEGVKKKGLWLIKS